MGCFRYSGHAAAVIAVFPCTLEFYRISHSELNIHFSFFFLQLSEQSNMTSLQLFYFYLSRQIDAE